MATKKTLKVTVAGNERTRTTSHDYKFVVAAVIDGEWAKGLNKSVTAGAVFSWHKTLKSAEQRLSAMTKAPKVGGLQINWIITPNCLKVVEVPAQ